MSLADTRHYRQAPTVEVVQAAHAAKLIAVAKMRKQLGEVVSALDEADKIKMNLSANMLALKRERTELLSEMPNGFVASAPPVEAVQASTLELSPGKGLWIVADEDMNGGDIAGIYIPTRVATNKGMEQQQLLFWKYEVLNGKVMAAVEEVD
jgi:hypothetical protein